MISQMVRQQVEKSEVKNNVDNEALKLDAAILIPFVFQVPIHLLQTLQRIQSKYLTYTYTIIKVALFVYL